MKSKLKTITTLCRKHKISVFFCAFFSVVLILCLSISAPEIYNPDTAGTGYKVSFNAPFTLHFSHTMNKKSTEQSFSITPTLNGKFTWKDRKTLEYYPSSKLVINDKYQITVTKNARSIYFKKLKSNYTIDFSVTGAPFVQFTSPMSILSDQKKNNLEIPSVYPDQIITVMFDRPMVFSEVEEENLLRITPPVLGKYRFLGDSAFQFIPDDLLPMGTRFKLVVPSGIPAYDGGETESDKILNIETPALKTIYTYPEKDSETVGLNQSITVHFNQFVDLNQIKPGTNAQLFPSNDADSSEKQKNDGFFNTEVTYDTNQKEEKNKSTLIFKPSFPYLPDTEYRFLIRAGLSGGPNKLRMKNDFELKFKTAPKPGVTDFIYPESKNNSIVIIFNTPVTEDILKNNISISPSAGKPYDIILDEDGKRAEILFRLTPDIEYVFTIKNGTKDIYGSKMESEYKTSFIAAEKPQILKWSKKEGEIDFLTKEENPEFTILTDSVSTIHLKMCRISENNFISFDVDKQWDQYKCLTEPKAIKIPENTEKTSFKLNTIFKTNKVQGMYYLSAESGENNKIFRILSITDTALILKKSKYENIVWATDILTGIPISGMNLTFFNYNGEALTKGKTDENGIYRIKKEMEEGIYISGTKKQDGINTNVIINEYWQKNNITENQYITTNNSNLLLYAISDKNTVYPNQELSIKGIIRIYKNALPEIPEISTLSLKLENGRGGEINIDEKVQLRVNGSFDVKFKIPREVPYGQYFVSAYTENGEKISSNKSKIEILNPKIPFVLEWINLKKDYAVNSMGKIKLSARYLNGIPVAGIRGEWELYRKPYFHTYSNYNYYSFNNSELTEYANISDEFVERQEFTFNKDGYTEINFLKKPEPGYEYYIKANIESKKNTNVFKSANFKIHHAEYYIGVNVKHHLVGYNDEIKIKIITQSANYNPVDNTKVRISIAEMRNNIEVKEWYKENILLSQGEADLSIPVIPDMPQGIYRITAETSDSTGNTVYSYDNIYIFGGNNNLINNEFSLFTDQYEYFAGGKAEIIVNTPFASPDKPVTALLIYNRGGIIDYQIVNLNNKLTPIEIAISDKMIPGMRISVVAIDNSVQPVVIKTASTVFFIGKRDREIKIDIQVTPENPKPGETVTVEFNAHDYQNRPIQAVLTVNVEGAEHGDINNNSFTNPLNYFYGNYFPIANTSSNLHEVHSGTENNLSTPYNPEFTSIINSSAYFNPLILTDGNGHAEIKFKLPKEDAEWRINAVAVNSAKNFGASQYKLNTKKRLKITPITPEFLMPGDETVIEANIKNLSEKELRTAIELLVTGAQIKGSAKKSTTINPEQSETISWTVKIDDFYKKDTFKIALRSSGDYTETKIPVGDLNIFEFYENSGTAKQGFTDKIGKHEEFVTENEEIQVAVSAMPINFIEEYISSIHKNPYESAEIKASQLIADLAAIRIGSENFSDKTMFDKKVIENRVENNISKLISIQRSDGGYGFWSDSENTDTWLSAYTLFALNKVSKTFDKKSFSQTEEIKENIIHFLWKEIKNNEELSVSKKIFIIWALSEAGEYDTGTALSLFKQTDDISSKDKAFLLITIKNLVNAGQKSVYPFLERLKSELVSDALKKGTKIFFLKSKDDFFDTDKRTSAIALMSLALFSDENPMLIPIINYLVSSQKKAANTFNTQEKIWIILALTEYMANLKNTAVNDSIQITVNGKKVADYSITEENTRKNNKVSVLKKELKNSNSVNEITIDKQSSSLIYFYSKIKYILSGENIAQSKDGVIIERDYYNFDDIQYSDPVINMNDGDFYNGKLTVATSKNMEYVAVKLPFPAGVKFLNFKQETENDFSSYSQIEMAEFNGVNWMKNSIWLFDYYDIDNNNLLLYSKELPAGVYTFYYTIQAVIPGRYNHLPASIEQMYQPSLHARTKGGWMEIINN